MGAQGSERNGERNSVAVVITTYNDSQYLREALRSVAEQGQPATEIFVVDDGSETSPAALVSEFPQAVFVQKRNGGLASARNVGLRAARAEFITFLDADDRYEPHALATGLRCFAEHPAAAMVFGGYRRIDAGGRRAGHDHFLPGSGDLYADLLRVNFIGMHATVLYRREVLLAEGGFEESFRASEDYDVYLRLARRYPIASHPDIIAEYRQHGLNMSGDNQRMLAATLAVHERHRIQTGSRRTAWYEGQRRWRAYYTVDGDAAQTGKGIKGAMRQLLRRIGKSIVWRAKRRLRGGTLHRMYRRVRPVYPPPFGLVKLGSLDTTRPISMDFGYERGNPIDRYYIEGFLERQSADVTGHVLEVSEDTYSKNYGGSKITKQDVLHYNLADPPVTIVGDMTVPGTLPDDTYDCIILTQTLQLIFELDKAIASLHAALKPGGVLLLTVPGISQTERTDWHHYWCWSFTESSIRQLFAKKFDPAKMQVASHGNVYSCITYLTGMALEEVDRAKLDVQDPAYPMIVTLRAQKN